MKGSGPNDTAPPHPSYLKVELLQAVLNYLMPTIVLPKINGKELRRNQWFSGLVRRAGLPACRSWFLAQVRGQRMGPSNDPK